MQIKDSGKREQFPGGAVRDIQDDKPRPDLICPLFLERLGMQLTHGAKKYDERNWEKGMGQTRVVASLVRHVLSLLAHRTDEDHAAAIAFNIMVFLSQEERFKLGILDGKWNDRSDATYRTHEESEEARVLSIGSNDRA